MIEQEFAGLGRVDRVVIYGSWARRHDGEPGPEPADVDFMVVGAPERDDVYAAAERSEMRLAMAVNPIIRSALAWQEASDTVVVTARNGPHVQIIDNTVGDTA